MPTPSTHHPDEFTFKEKLQYTLLGFVVVGGSFLLGRSLIRKAASNAEEKRTFEQGNPAMYAQQIRMALENDGWPGKDLPALRQVIQAVPSIAEFKKVINSYQRLYARSLMMDLKKDLKTSEYNEMLAILAGKPAKGDMAVPVQLNTAQFQSWAQRLKAAFDKTYGIFPGTDEPAIKAVFMELPTQAAYQQLGIVYKAMYGNELESDLHSELEFWEYPSYMKIITDKPKT
jgi:hypothetical protein